VYLTLKYRYNELKKSVLASFIPNRSFSSLEVVDRLRDDQKIVSSVRAIQMALMRYVRLGLLHREWSGGVYSYSLSEKGARRLLWLQSLEHKKMS
jgi:hypothetical protein